MHSYATFYAMCLGLETYRHEQTIRSSNIRKGENAQNFWAAFTAFKYTASMRIRMVKFRQCSLFMKAMERFATMFNMLFLFQEFIVIFINGYILLAFEFHSFGRSKGMASKDKSDLKWIANMLCANLFSTTRSVSLMIVKNPIHQTLFLFTYALECPKQSFSFQVDCFPFHFISHRQILGQIGVETSTILISIFRTHFGQHFC